MPTGTQLHRFSHINVVSLSLETVPHQKECY